MVTQDSLEQTSITTSYLPLFVIIGLIILVTVVLALRALLMESFQWSVVMSNFMAGFFLVFSGFKLLDLKGFAQGYSMYDLLAKKWFSYGYVYPFIELILGLCYAAKFAPPLVDWFTFVIMLFSGTGVLLKILMREKFQCACLGTFLKVPLTKVTLIEDFGMAIMALLMLVV
ncbi:MAG: MauE/DoxX family redox-associated membrane protein [Nitrosotalea sp.]